MNSTFRVAVCALIVLLNACGNLPTRPIADAGTAAQREALFEDIVAKTMRREAFSSVKNQQLGLSFPRDFESFRQQFIDADSEQALYWAIVRLSNSRYDRHLSVSPVDNGLAISKTYHAFKSDDYPGIELDPGKDPVVELSFLPDYAGTAHGYFVAAVATGASSVRSQQPIQIGDRVTAINGTAIERWLERINPYYRYSTYQNFLYRSALDLSKKSTVLPRDFYTDQLILQLQAANGERYQVVASYLPSETVNFAEPRPKYPGFDRVQDHTSFDIYVPNDNRRLLILDWYGFRDDLITATDSLVEYAQEHHLLDYDLIIDATRSRGGGRGAYAIQRLQSKPFKTTFGNLRLSDVVAPFVAGRVRAYEEREEQSDGTPETLDDGSWLIDWLTNDVLTAQELGRDYSENVPFKLAHAPKQSDGVLAPAPIHFTGRMVCWFSPYGGSHLDQFAAITADNDLCHSLGMPTGGYSNTWEWDEVLTWPGTTQPVVEYMWSIGHTVRPNGEVLEGNPALVDDYIPLTADNHRQYREMLMRRSIDWLRGATTSDGSPH